MLKLNEQGTGAARPDLPELYNKFSMGDYIQFAEDTARFMEYSNPGDTRAVDQARRISDRELRVRLSLEMELCYQSPDGVIFHNMAYYHLSERAWANACREYPGTPSEVYADISKAFCEEVSKISSQKNLGFLNN